MAKRKGRRGQKRKDLKRAKKENRNNVNNTLSTEKEQNQEISCDRHNAALSPPLAAEGMVGPSSRQSFPEPRRGRKKKRLDEVAVASVGPTTHQNGEQAKLEVPPVNNGAVFASKQQMPEKRILEFILDILQRRDTHEIFAQPVDQNEVEGYYSIVEEPMDFGTMRAKLQEEIYTTLEQFEKDVFLITSNAMLFNSSSTIYFRQARAIHELAKRVFHTLKTEPQKIELEFSLTSRRHGRKPRGEYRSPQIKPGPKLRVNSLADPHDNDILPGYGRNVNCNRNERRKMYAPQHSTANEGECIASMVYSSSKLLVPGNGDIGYKESLLRFIGDLGPIAQKVAHQQLRCSAPTPIPPISSTASQHTPTGLNGVMSSVNTAVENPQDSQDTISRGKNILISESTGIDSSIFKERMEIETERPNFPNAVSKGKGVLIGDSMDFCGAPICREPLPCSQNIQSQLCSSYLPHVQLQPPPCASVPQPALFEFLSSSSNRRPKSSVYPSMIIRPSGPNQPMALMHGPGQESNVPLNLNFGASLSPKSQPVEWSLPSLWGPQAIVDVHANLLGSDVFKQQDGPQLPVDQFVQAKYSSDTPLGPDGLLQRQSGQVASATPYAQVQPTGMNSLGQDAVLQQWFPGQSGYAQPQPSLLDLLGQGMFTQPNPLGQDAFVLQGPELVAPQYVVPPNYVNAMGWNGFPSQETQLGIPHQGVMSDPRYLNDKELMIDHQQTTDAEFWNFQQQFLGGTTSHHPDLDLRLQTHNQR